MKKNFALIALFLAISGLTSGSDSGDNDKLWQRHPGNPALQWESQVFHLGNGYFGVSAYSGVKQERITLAEKTMWTGGPGDDTGYNYLIKPEKDHSYIGEIKKLTSAGDIREADRLVAKYLCNEVWTGLGGLSSAGSLVIDFEGHDGTAEQYVRSLDLSKSVLTAKYSVGGVSYSREYFCSYPGRIFAIRLIAGRPGSVTFGLRLDLMHRKRNPQTKIMPSTGMLEVAGSMNDNNRPYRIKIKVVNEGGIMSSNDSVLFVKGSDAATIYYTIATDYELKPPMFRGADPDKITSDAKLQALLSQGVRSLRMQNQG